MDKVVLGKHRVKDQLLGSIRLGKVVLLCSSFAQMSRKLRQKDQSLLSQIGFLWIAQFVTRDGKLSVQCLVNNVINSMCVLIGMISMTSLEKVTPQESIANHKLKWQLNATRRSNLSLPLKLITLNSLMVTHTVTDKLSIVQIMIQHLVHIGKQQKMKNGACTVNVKLMMIVHKGISA